jgi:hypothetical protein
MAIASGSFVYQKAIPELLTPISYCIVLGLTIFSTQLMADHGIMTFLKYGLDKNDKLGDWLFFAIVSAIAFNLLFHAGLSKGYREVRLAEKYKSGGLMIIISILGGLLAPVLMWVWLGFIAIILAILAIFAPLKVLSILIRKNIIIPFGVIVGGLSGLIYGWTHLDFTMTSLAMTSASIVGMISAWLIVKAESTINDVTEFLSDFVPFG